MTRTPSPWSRFCHRCATAATLLGLPLTGCQGSRPDDLGAKDGQLRPCSSRPNCVESRTGAEEEHKIAAIDAGTDPDATFKRLTDILAQTERAALITKTADYVHAEFSSKLMGFVDDAEFLLDRASNSIQVRSSARLGYRDFGVNREHIEAVRSQLAGDTTAKPPTGG